MSHKAIVLWDPKANTKLASDDACTTIIQYELPRAPSTIRPPYQSPHPPDVKLRYVPPLAYFCIKALAEYPDEMHALGAARLRYEAPRSHSQFDILSALIPTYRSHGDTPGCFNLSLVDPRLWAVVIQAYEGLPSVFRQYTLPLSDAHVPLLQTIPSTKHFSLITILSLTRCRVLTDDTILELGRLHTLVAFDASVTGVSTWGIGRLAKSLDWCESEPGRPAERRGPWGLRLLDLRDCINVDDKVLLWLNRFPLLTVVACADTHLFHPNPPSDVLDHLIESTDTHKKPLFSHPKPFILNINALHHKPSIFDRKYNNLYRDTDDTDHRPVETIGRRKDVFLPYVRPHQGPSPSETIDAILAARPPAPAPAYDDDDEDSESEHSDGESDRAGDSTDGYLSPQPLDDGPWDMDEDHFGEGLAPRSPRLEPQPDDGPGWMDEVAEDEGRNYLRQHDAVMFYAQPAPRRTASLPYTHTPQTQPNLKADPLMLFRRAPPWSALPTSPPAKPVSKAAASSTSALHGMPSSVFAADSTHAHAYTHAQKRKRTGSALEDQAERRRMHALSSIQGLYSMVQKSRDSKAKAKDGENLKAGGQPQAQVRMVMPGRVNPFARTAQAGRQKEAPTVTLKRKAAETSSERASDASGSGSRSAGAKAGSSSSKPVVAAQAAASPLKVSASERAGHTSTASSTEQNPSACAAETPRPAKKLKPITSLTVPEWPNASHKPVSHHAPKPKPPPPKPQVQSTLPVSRSSAKPPDKAKEKRRVSAPVVTTPRLEMVAEVKLQVETSGGMKGKVDKASSKSGKGKEREKKGAGFDWNSWGGR
ncbi:hypothetical protein TRAPUB_3067 [Trametes pubescens]|uniref:Uncharacterized protein n=1 Tax=Trametes pubescens TaxID=154538 RepID=A0A1M2VEU8_TRAPU|nr:hypothetical protein TRAPUB_3067 [Trametes pubescens]